MNTITKLKNALAALEVSTTHLAKDRQEILSAREGLNSVIAGMEAGEPVAYLANSPTKGNGRRLFFNKQEAHYYANDLTPLYALTAQPKAEPVQDPMPPFGSKRKAAMAVYTAPFVYKYGYIYDSQKLIVADNGGIGKDEPGVEGAVAARVRGWGRLGYLPNGAELQDEIGQMMADALNALYTAPPARQPLTDAQIQEIYLKVYNEGFSGRSLESAFARAIEAFHGIKGGAQ